VEAVSLAKQRPLLQGIFGPLEMSEEASLRAILSEVDEELLRLARHFGRDRAGFEGTGLDLQWFRSGQLVLSSDVATGDRDAHAASFLLNLWPSWSHEAASGLAEWIIEATIDVDCQHTDDHGSMETVYDRGQTRTRTPLTAAQELLAAARELVRLAVDHPIEYWTSKTKS
jgi:hypothetical protein